jgi:FKBP-type peptidyl-prolyl cis-trans isomerase
MKKFFWFFALSFVVLLTSCLSNNDVDPAEAEKLKENEAAVKKYITDNNLTVKQDASGFYYNIDALNPTAKSPKVGDLVTMDFVIKKLTGEVVDSSRINQKIPYAYIFGVYNNLFNYPINLMKEGDKGIFLFPQLVSKGDPVKIEISLISSLGEDDNINKYIGTNYPTTNFFKSSTGLRYAITTENPSGTALLNGKTVTLKYTGRLLFDVRKTDTNNKLYYDSKFDEGTISFTLGASQVVPGFEEAVSKLKVGEKGIGIFPSTLGYSTSGSYNQATGNYVIPPYASLLFEMEVTAVK